MNLRPRLPDRVVLAWSPVCSGEFPQGCQIENRPLELDTECNKCSRKIEHWLERRHLFGRLDGIPEADVRHCVVRAVDADVIAQVSAHRADTSFQHSFALDQFGLDNRGFVGIEGPQSYSNDRCCHIPLLIFLLRAGHGRQSHRGP